MGTTVSEIESDRITAALSAAVRFDSVVVLKGRHTIIATPDNRILVNTTGNSGLAKGGSGDVLSGIIGSFLAQGYTPTESALLGVYLHGKAADILKETMSEFGIIPSDIPEMVGRLLKSLTVSAQ